MSYEKYVAQEKEVKQLTEKERKKQIEKVLTFSKEKKELIARLEKKKELEFLKSLIERGLLWVHAAEIIANTEWLESEQIAEIFEKIDAIEAVPRIESILPVHLRLTKEEYAEALNNEAARTHALTKLDQALQHLYESSHPDHFSPASLFFSALMMLNKNLVLVQENTIDIKRSLHTS